MSKTNVNVSGGGIGLGGVLFVVFLILKLCSVIDWSWWWVTAPLWIPVAFVLSILLVVLVVVGIAGVLDAKKGR